ncbi:MAG: hypothetical protein M1318_02295 [Firmicutes bacterium]|jgi:hypothetical protein|nr:hypothetical protein [Bacillota bacterium]
MELLTDPTAVVQALQNGDDVSWQVQETADIVWMHWDPDRRRLVMTTDSPREVNLTLSQLWTGVWYRRDARVP